MKILGGELQSRSLKAPKGDVTRPTTSLVRKALFDIIQPIIEDANVLDLFSGSGAIGIEALSRGARHATFIEKDKIALRCLQENLRTFQLEKRSTLIAGDVFKHLSRFRTSFTLIVADPPYKDDVLPKLLTIIEEHNLLAPGGFLFLEAPFPSTLPPTRLTLLKSRRYGKTVLHELTLASTTLKMHNEKKTD
jgi:16S rRNA (guanine966-N2)-methyltransferase